MEQVVVAHAFYAGTQPMPPGTYSIACDHCRREIVLADAAGHTVRLRVRGVILRSERDSTQMDFIKDGERLVLHQVHLREHDHVDIADVLAQPAPVVNIAEYRHRR
jgi:hypothetical protein